MNEEMSEFARDLIESIKEAQRGEYARIHTPEEISARIAKRAAGRPVGSAQAVTKKAISLRIAPEALEQMRCTGKGWQTRAAEVLERHAKRAARAITASK
jgi:uncharacterized protein (DUF4415 family)